VYLQLNLTTLWRDVQHAVSEFVIPTCWAFDSAIWALGVGGRLHLVNSALLPRAGLHGG
jgi:hypothetical protein